MLAKTITVALAGNPNSGKTTLFNALTGARQRVGNYPGVTVEKKMGVRLFQGHELRFVDLPGTYSLAAQSQEEVVARDFIIGERPDVVVDVLDAANLERNLYLGTQLLELEVPLVMALNMVDLAEKRGYRFNAAKLSSFFDASVVPTIASKGMGIEHLLQTIIDAAEHEDRAFSGDRAPCPELIPQARGLRYGEGIEEALHRIESVIRMDPAMDRRYSSKWLSLKLLEKDEEILRQRHSTKILEAVEESSSYLRELYGDTPDILIAEKRYGFISNVCQEAVVQAESMRLGWGDWADKILLHRVFGILLFLGMMYAVFWTTFAIGDPLADLTMGSIEGLGTRVAGLWAPGADSLLQSLIVDGIIGGVGGVIGFLPNILLLFLGIALLEDSGYMARGAFLMDRIMQGLGLHGKSFIPMMIGFGCTIPAIMGTRILENNRSRLITILVLPLMSCGARLTIYALIIPAFFPAGQQALALWSIYVMGILVAGLCSILLAKTFFKGERDTFLMELPPYRMPTLKSLIIHVWERSWLYLKKAGTIILSISILLWAAATFPRTDPAALQGLDPEAAQARQLRNTLAGRIGTAMEPALSPLGFDYRIGTALIGALAAKEVFVAQLGIVFSIGETDENSVPLKDKLMANYTPLQGYCVMIFCLISAPCMATLAMARREMNSWPWAIGQNVGLTLLAYTVTLIVYQIGSHII